MGALHTIGVADLRKGSSADIGRLSEIVDSKIPALRRIAAPLHQRIGDPASNISPIPLATNVLDSPHHEHDDQHANTHRH
jgi:hypothetical protein